MYARFSLALASVALAIPAFALDVTRQIEVDAPAAQVWEVVGSFCSIGDWHPGIDNCTEEAKDGATYRRLVMSDGAEFLEKYTEVYSDLAYGYEIIEGPLPVTDYKAVFKVKNLGTTAMIEWSSTFAAEGATDQDATDAIGDMFQAGLDALKVQFAATH